MPPRPPPGPDCRGWPNRPPRTARPSAAPSALTAARCTCCPLFDVTTGCVRAQREIDAKTNEIPELAPAIAHLDLIGTVVTADALHTQAETARYLVEDKKAHYLMIIKGNQPSLLAAVAKALAGPDTDFADTAWTEEGKGHGRRERRSIRTAPAAGIAWPHAAQVLRIRRDSGPTRGPLDAQGDRLRHHQPARRPGRPPPPRRLCTQPLGNRKQGALRPGQDVRRRPPAGPHREPAERPRRHPQPGHRRLPPHRVRQHRPRPPLLRPRRPAHPLPLRIHLKTDPKNTGYITQTAGA